MLWIVRDRVIPLSVAAILGVFLAIPTDVYAQRGGRERGGTDRGGTERGAPDRGRMERGGNWRGGEEQGARGGFGGGFGGDRGAAPGDRGGFGGGFGGGGFGGGGFGGGFGGGPPARGNDPRGGGPPARGDDPRGGGERGGDRRGGPPPADRRGGGTGEQPEGARQFDPTEMLKRMDTNGDGVLDENELDGRAGGFVRRLQERAGMGTTGTVSIEKLSTELAKQQGESSGDRGRGGREPLVKYGGTDFGVSTELAPVLGFDAPPDSLSGSWQAKYDERIVAQVNELMTKHDTNKSHYLEPHEWPEVPFRSDPIEDDADGDGRISRAELAAHLEKHANRNRRGGDDRNTDRGRGDDARNVRTDVRGGDNANGANASAATPRISSSSDPNRRHAENLMKEYDVDGDGYLDEEEWINLRGGDPAEFDRNNDGKLSLEELTARVASINRSVASSDSYNSGSSSSVKGRFLTPAERLPRGLPDWFKRSDADGDGQISMAEFTDSWTESKLKEFERYDLNGDGVITAQEALEASSRR